MISWACSSSHQHKTILFHMIFPPKKSVSKKVAVKTSGPEQSHQPFGWADDPIQPGDGHPSAPWGRSRGDRNGWFLKEKVTSNFWK